MTRYRLALTWTAIVPLAVVASACTPPEEDSPFGFTLSTSVTLGDGDGDDTGDDTGAPPNCGDGVVDPGEECDLGDQNNDSDKCTPVCTIAACGDGYLYAGVEECDDGNLQSTDECTAACEAAECGDGYVHQGVEQCDDGNDVETDECTSACTPSDCGDGVIQAGEQCDDGNDIDSDDCPSSCQFAFCGDGFIKAGVEICDDGNTESNDACTYPLCEPAECGDGIIWEGMEECDDGNTEDTDACPECMVGFCGDGFVNIGVEECDDANQIDDDFCMNDCTSNGYYDDFETNNLMLLPWMLSGNANWATVNTMPHQGSYCAANGNIGNSQSSTMEVTLMLPQAGVVAFWYRVSSETSYDYLRFYVDNSQQGQWSGNVSWAQAQYNVTAGNHTFRWTYSKDGSLDGGSDTAWVDEVYIGVAPP